MRPITWFGLAGSLALLAGCMSIKESTPLRAEVARKGIAISRSLPQLPGSVSPIPDSQYVLVQADSAVATAVSMAVPVPFVTDMAIEAMHQQEAGGYRGRYASVDPYAIAVERMQGSPLLGTGAGALKLMPFVYIVEGADARYRLSLVFRVEGEGWMGRYFYHLPTTYSIAEIRDPKAPMLASLRAELIAGSDILRGLLEREARGELAPRGARVDIGSYHLVGGNLSGLISASALHYPDNELVEEGADYVVVRARGDMGARGNAGYLVYGLHYFRKDQLHTYRKKAGAAK